MQCPCQHRQSMVPSTCATQTPNYHQQASLPCPPLTPPATQNKPPTVPTQSSVKHRCPQELQQLWAATCTHPDTTHPMQMHVQVSTQVWTYMHNPQHTQPLVHMPYAHMQATSINKHWRKPPKGSPRHRVAVVVAYQFPVLKLLC